MLSQPSRAIFALLVCSVFIGCETNSNIPTELPEDVLPETFVVIDRATLQPSEEVAAGSTLEFNAELSYRISEAELATWQSQDLGPVPGVFVWLDAAVLRGLGWRGELATTGTTVYQTTELEGKLSLNGDLYLPKISSLCQDYDRFGATGVVLTERLLFEVGTVVAGRAVSEKTAGFPEVDVAGVAVAGSVAPAGPCAIFQRDGVTQLWGAMHLFLIRHAPDRALRTLPGPTSPVLITIGGRPAPISVEDQTRRSFGGETQEWGRYRVWVPAGLPAGSHAVRAFTDAGEIAYGNDRPTEVWIPGPEDIFDRLGNDSFEEAKDDFISEDFRDFVWSEPGILVLNPGLSLPADDQIVDPSANPLGSSEWGVGDWFVVPVESDMDVCAKVEPSAGDDIDLMIFDAGGALVASATTGGDAVESLRVDGLPAGSELRMWVAPASITTEFGIYAVKAWDCAITEPMVE